MEMDDDIYMACADPGYAFGAVRGDHDGGTITWYDLIIVGLYRDHRSDGCTIGSGLETLLTLAADPRNPLRGRMEKL